MGIMPMTDPRALQFAMSEPWAILPDRLEQILAIAERTNTESIEAVATRLGKPLKNTRTVSNRNGVAVVPVEGPVFRYANLLTEISGATSIEVLAKDFQTALDDPEIKAIILQVDSPGGMVSGTSEFAQQVYQARGIKPVVAYISDLGASAAYWIASAASEVVASDTALIGSIGVVGTYRTDKDDKSIELVSSQSPNKRPDITTDAGKAQVQEMLDKLGAVFVDKVAEYRAVSTEKVTADFGGGSVLVGQVAVDAGLADRLGTLEGLIAQYSKKVKSKNNGGKTSMLTADIRAEHPELVTAFKKEGFDEGYTIGRAEGAAYENDRIKAVEEQSLPGHEALVAALKFDGKTTGPEAAVKVLAAEKAAGSSYLDKIKADAPKALPQSLVDPFGSDAIDPNLPLEDQCKAAWDKDPTVRAEFSTIGAYTAYRNAEAAGKIKILTNG